MDKTNGVLQRSIHTTTETSLYKKEEQIMFTQKPTIMAVYIFEYNY